MQRRGSFDFENTDNFLATAGDENCNNDVSLSSQQKTGDSAHFSAPLASATLTPKAAPAPAFDEGKWALEQAQQQATATALAMVDYKPGNFLNRKVKNPRGFYETEVTFEFSATPVQMADMVKKGTMPHLSLTKTARNFELPGTPEGKERTKMHAQGNIYLTEVRSTFPCALAFEMSDRLRGNNIGSSTAHTGARGHYLALPKEHKTFDNQPKLLVESDPGILTSQYVKTYPEYLKGMESLKKSISPLANNSKFYMVKSDSPIVAIVNTARSEAGLPQLIEDATSKLMGTMPIAKEEVNNAIEYLDDLMKSDVNYVDLYRSLKIGIKRPFHTASVNSEKGEEWLSLHEFDVKSNIKGSESAEEKSAAASALNKKYSVYFKILVEYKPHVDEIDSNADAAKSAPAAQQ